MPLTPDQTLKFSELTDDLNVQVNAISELTQKLRSILTVDAYGPYLIDDPSGLMLESIKISCSNIITELQNVLSKL